MQFRKRLFARSSTNMSVVRLLCQSDTGLSVSGNLIACPRSASDGQGRVLMERFQILVADEVLDDLRARLRGTRWPDQVPGIGWKQGTELEWLRRLVSYWADEFDWRVWERKLNALDHFTWEGIHFVHRRAVSGRGVPLILTHGWPSSFLDYVNMLPMLEDFDVLVPSLPGYGFSPPARGRHQLPLRLRTLARAHDRVGVFPLCCGGQ